MEGFVHATAGRLVDGRGEPLMLRGVGLGNWLLAEGYMWKFEAPGPQSPREIEALVEDLVGPDLAAEFWRRFRAAFIAEADIARIAAEGMNHVRLPINSRVVMDEMGDLIEPGLALVDGVIEWCRTHGLWVVLDLHGAPGGQTGTNIDDSPHRAPELFTEPRYRAMTVKLWQALARRYRDETAVAAYDLLNEPLPNEYQHLYASQLRALYRDLTAAIREVDPNHMISYEGTHWATNWELFTEVWDPNSILQFHKYWSAPDRPSLEGYMSVGRALGLPIYMGEGGENHLDWVQTAFQLYDDLGISWTFWTWKKVDTLTSPCSVDAPPGWRVITDFAAAKGPKPDRKQAEQILEQLVEAMPLARCTYRPEVIAALFRRPPLKIPAIAFGFRGAGDSYQTSAAAPLRGFREDDSVTIRRSGAAVEALDWNHNGASRPAADELLVSLRAGDWVAYDVATTAPSPYQITAATMAGDGSPLPSLEMSVDGKALATEAAAESVRGTTDQLAAGRHLLRLTARSGEVLLRSITVVPAPDRQSMREREEGRSSVR